MSVNLLALFAMSALSRDPGPVRHTIRSAFQGQDLDTLDALMGAGEHETGYYDEPDEPIAAPQVWGKVRSVYHVDDVELARAVRYSAARCLSEDTSRSISLQQSRAAEVYEKVFNACGVESVALQAVKAASERDGFDPDNYKTALIIDWAQMSKDWDYEGEYAERSW